MDSKRLESIIESIEDQGLRVKEYDVQDDAVYQVITDNSTSAGKGPVTILIIRE